MKKPPMATPPPPMCPHCGRDLEDPRRAISLFYIRANSEDGENMDLFVNAYDSADAERLWRAYYDGWDLQLTYVRNLSEITPYGVISWETINQGETK